MMLTLQAALRGLLVDLELTQAERERIDARLTELRGRLAARLPVDEFVCAGAYARGVAVRPRVDVDVFVALRPGEGITPSTSPGLALEALVEAVEGRIRGARTRWGARSVTVRFAGSSIIHHLIPARAEDDEIYMIPDDGARRWIPAAPRIHAAKASAANRRAGDKLRPLVKAIKHANNEQGRIARPFHLEALAWQVLTDNPGTFVDGLVLLLDGLAQRICERCPDPAGLGPDLQPSPERCRAAQGWLTELAESVRRARSLDAMARRGEAQRLMRGIFGAAWPGRARAAGRRLYEERRMPGAAVERG
ncbi:MAG: nucleotidyltransferase [Myxococcales bacterium]|nr:nucleotidyltransferase [Myxococcales bacterium]